MKKTLTVNLGGTVFHIDEDAYQLLDKYLSNLRIHFRKEEGSDEIMDDLQCLYICLLFQGNQWNLINRNVLFVNTRYLMIFDKSLTYGGINLYLHL